MTAKTCRAVIVVGARQLKPDYCPGARIRRGKEVDDASIKNDARHFETVIIGTVFSELLAGQRVSPGPSRPLRLFLPLQTRTCQTNRKRTYC